MRYTLPMHAGNLPKKAYGTCCQRALTLARIYITCKCPDVVQRQAAFIAKMLRSVKTGFAPEISKPPTCTPSPACR